METPHPQDLVTSRFPSWMACRDDPFRCDLPGPMPVRQPDRKKACKPRPMSLRFPRRKIVHRLDSADREPPPIPLKVPRTSVGSPVEDLVNSPHDSDDTEESDGTPSLHGVVLGELSVTREVDVEKRSPLLLPIDLAYAIATLGSFPEDERSPEIKSVISPSSDGAEGAHVNDQQTSNPMFFCESPTQYSSKRFSLASSLDNQSQSDVRPSLGSRSDCMGSEETARPLSQKEEVVEFDAARAMENLSKRLSMSPSCSAPASSSYRRHKDLHKGKHRLSVASSSSQLYVDGQSSHSPRSYTHGSNSVESESESDTSSLGLRARAKEESSSDRSRSTRSQAQMKDREEQRLRHINGLGFLRTTRSLDRKLLFGFGNARNATSDSFSVHSVPSEGLSKALSGSTGTTPQKRPTTPRSKQSESVARCQSRASGLWGKFKDYMPAGSLNTSYS
ncbi:hypothetical protein SCHPADRAFT_70026 [Schizopora paradoxa]|uniref:Uncharacterized protein n=1 Tax=Schizopora paradoxa TaxID=27342 RepID=A0A0H2S4Y6_9AGAM|nr:hypothetical protein SCHPADRAFT_70026 [Schizopora paradoxa]